MLSAFSSRWDDRLRRISITQHSVDPTSENKSRMQSSTYWPGPKYPLFSAAEMYKMLQQVVIKPTTAKSMSPMVLLTKNGMVCFVSTTESEA